jgi:uncharacterized protein (TIGR02996 family)
MGSHLAGLLEAVHADPDDLETRLVYADALSEAGDPRGELIALQCRRGDAPASERELELLAEHGAAWLGRLEPILDPAHTVFERGFLSRARVKKVPRPKLLRAAGDPTWATVTELEFDDAVRGVVLKHGPVVRGARVPTAAVLLHPIMRALREVRGIDGDVLLTLCTEGNALPFRAITGVTYPLLERGADDMWHVEAGARAAIEVAAGLPQLRRLSLHGYPCDVPDMSWLIRSPLGARLEHLHLGNFGGAIDHWVAAARDAPPSLRELVVDYWGVAQLRRSNTGRLDALELDARDLTAHQRSLLDAGLARIPAGHLSSVKVKE